MSRLVHSPIERQQWLRAAGMLLGVLVPALALAQGTTLYKCTTATGTLIYSDRACAADGSAQAAPADANPAQAIVRQEIVHQRKLDPAASDFPSAATITRRCEAPTGTPMTIDAALRVLPERQRAAFEGMTRQLVLGGLKRPDLDASTLHLDARQTLVWCLPQGQRLRAYLVESNGRIVELTRSGKVKSRNDANDPITLAGRCGDLVTTCFAPGVSGHSLDQCFAAAPACPAGSLDPAASCCPQACKDAYRRARDSGTDPLTASMKVLYGDRDNASTCVSGAALN